MDFHNRKSIRQCNHDYSQPCSYFITINIKMGQCLFGKATSENEIQLNELGKMAQKLWIEIPDHFNHVQMDEFVIMPNHLHGIIHVGSLHVHDTSLTYPTDQYRDLPITFDVVQYIATSNKPNTANQFGSLPKGSLAVIIGQYKSAITRWANQNRLGGLFSWHSLFYDRIISDSTTLTAAQLYIRQNPAKWWKKYRDQSW
ncbi:MAG TPA: hypothetical protein VFC65_07060 [Prolixibacteraceae bacterium]|nr:hypothetical protein [Prolixibacteraceae bacterium]